MSDVGNSHSKHRASAAAQEPLPAFRVGDTVRVWVLIKEGDKERSQAFEGVVIKRHHHGARSSFTVRKISYGVGGTYLPISFAAHRPRGGD